MQLWPLQVDHEYSNARRCIYGTGLTRDSSELVVALVSEPTSGRMLAIAIGVMSAGESRRT
jgi:hypothetical protein